MVAEGDGLGRLEGEIQADLGQRLRSMAALSAWRNSFSEVGPAPSRAWTKTRLAPPLYSWKVTLNLGSLDSRATSRIGGARTRSSAPASSAVTIDCGSEKTLISMPSRYG